MANREKLLRQALESPKNLRFEDLCKLAESYGFKLKKSAGTSHRVFKRDGYGIMNFQNDGGKAKLYQITQLLDALRELGEIE